MTRTDLDRIRQRQRHYEWDLARDAHATAAAKLVAGKTHDLSNLVQIVQLATGELARRCGDDCREFLADLDRASVAAQTSLAQMMTMAWPEPAIARGVPVGVAITAAVDIMRSYVAIDMHLAVDPETATRCMAEDLEHLVLGLALDVLGRVPRLELFVRERQIEGKPWVEIVRGALSSSAIDGFELRVVEAIALRAGGELAVSERREGGTEVVVALPVVRA